MAEIVRDGWLEFACEWVERDMLAGLTKPGWQYMLMREAICRGRKDARPYGNDSLVGFLTGLMPMLWTLGVKPELLKLGQVPYRSWFFGEKSWDNLIEDPNGRAVARIEMKCISVTPRSDIMRLFADMPGMVGLLFDHHLSQPKCFTGLVLVSRLRKPAARRVSPRYARRIVARRHAIVKQFLGRLRGAGLLREALYYEECDGTLSCPVDFATTATFLSALRDVILRTPGMIDRSAWLKTAPCATVTSDERQTAG